MRLRLIITAFLIFSGLFAMTGCGTIGYYSQAVGGHLRLMRAREPISTLLADENLDADLRQKLETLAAARTFANDVLSLPRTDSYTSYVATGRRYVTWNVVAADEFSVNPRLWCFPVAGCVSYRGYFDESDARAYATEIAEADRLDVTVGGASAYSTLGWFDDPVLDTMLRGGDIRYVSTLFHEMAHQLLYVKDDSNYNEAFATFVEQEGMRIWLRSRNEENRVVAYDAYLQRAEDFSSLLASTRQNLQGVYARDLDPESKRAAKASVFDALREDYEALKVSWDNYSGYDGWFARDLNNARLVSVATYRRYVPAFAVMFREAGNDLPAFYELAREIAELSSEARAARMTGYLDAL